MPIDKELKRIKWSFFFFFLFMGVSFVEVFAPVSNMVFNITACLWILSLVNIILMALKIERKLKNKAKP